LKYPISSGGSGRCLEMKSLSNMDILGKYLHNKIAHPDDFCILDCLRGLIALMDTRQNHLYSNDDFHLNIQILL
jgi:hypothetical protein